LHPIVKLLAFKITLSPNFHPAGRAKRSKCLFNGLAEEDDSEVIEEGPKLLLLLAK